MSMVEFFSEEILQEKPAQIVYKANELIGYFRWCSDHETGWPGTPESGDHVPH